MAILGKIRFLLIVRVCGDATYEQLDESARKTRSYGSFPFYCGFIVYWLLLFIFVLVFIFALFLLFQPMASAISVRPSFFTLYNILAKRISAVLI